MDVPHTAKKSHAHLPLIPLALWKTKKKTTAGVCGQHSAMHTLSYLMHNVYKIKGV